MNNLLASLLGPTIHQIDCHPRNPFNPLPESLVPPFQRWINSYNGLIVTELSQVNGTSTHVSYLDSY